MKGKLQNTTNGWMIQYEHCGIDNISFYPLHPDDPFNNSIEKYEGKEVEFMLVHSWNALEEKLIEVAIINAKITDVTNIPIHIHEGITNIHVYIQDGVIHIKPNNLKNITQKEKDYIYSYEDAISFMNSLQHEKEYEVLDFVSNKWKKQKYMFLIDNNEQEQPQKMIHWFRMGWIK